MLRNFVVALSVLFVLISTARADVIYRWHGDAANTTDLAKSIAFEITVSDGVAADGSLVLAESESSCHLIFPCDTYLSSGLSRIAFSITGMNPQIDTSHMSSLNFYDLGIQFGSEFLTGSIFAGNFGSTFRMHSSGNVFSIDAVGSDTHPFAMITASDNVRGTLERVSVPEPSTLSLIILAVGLVSIARRKG